MSLNCSADIILFYWRTKLHSFLTGTSSLKDDNDDDDDDDVTDEFYMFIQVLVNP